MTTAWVQSAVSRFAIVIYDPRGELALVVEVKNKPRATPDWAAQMRRNLAVHLVLGDLLPQRRGYIGRCSLLPTQRQRLIGKHGA